MPLVLRTLTIDQDPLQVLLTGFRGPGGIEWMGPEQRYEAWPNQSGFIMEIVKMASARGLRQEMTKRSLG